MGLPVEADSGARCYNNGGDLGMIHPSGERSDCVRCCLAGGWTKHTVNVCSHRLSGQGVCSHGHASQEGGLYKKPQESAVEGGAYFARDLRAANEN
ncbi:hypothetical protein J6590_001915 [Homalodisca vitripennis]|nr:hypothetical protein J6590_001915 [Homalodisca vitripennis]